MAGRMKDGETARKGRRAARLITAALLALFAAWLIWGNTALMISRVTVKDEGIPAAFDGFRIAQVSDLHNAEFGEGNARLLDMLRNAAPDIIVITGDLVDANRTDIPLALHFASEAVKIAPVYYVTGNHEGALRSYGTLREGLEQAGVTVLKNAVTALERGGESVKLIGLDDVNFAFREELSSGPGALLEEKLNALGTGGGFSIVLAHRPEYIDYYAAAGAGLVLSGHAHGGQFRLPFIGGLIAPGQGLFPKYDAGLYRSGGTQMVVSRGLGNSVIPLRVNNRPEIVLVTLEHG